MLIIVFTVSDPSTCTVWRGPASYPLGSSVDHISIRIPSLPIIKLANGELFTYNCLSIIIAIVIGIFKLMHVQESLWQLCDHSN